MQEMMTHEITQREKEILHLLANFHNYNEMRDILGISLKTVNRHIENIMKKTGIHRKDLLTKYALEHEYGKVLA
jgi:DNA-binding CsgD family transcriptional regulator